MKYLILAGLLTVSALSAEVNPLNKKGAASTKRFSTGAIISNGTISLGVNDTGSLIYNGVGLTYLPTSGEALAPGCSCESWGVADAGSGRYGKAGEDSGDLFLVADSFTSTATTATATVKVADRTGDLFLVTHHFAPSSNTSLYETTVTIENISGTNVSDLRYRRAMDWDVPPTEFDELVTLITSGATNVIYTSDNGFADGNPLAADTHILFTGEATDSGPEDHGALFDFSFGSLADGDSFTFTIFYGAVGVEVDALPALSDVNADNVYSLGKPNPAVIGVNDGSPNTFIFGFKGVGGTSLGGSSNVLSPRAIPAVTTIGSISILLSLLLLILYQQRRGRNK